MIASSTVLPIFCIGRTTPICARWPWSVVVYGWHPTQSLVRRLVLKMGLNLTFVIGLGKDGRPQPKRPKAQA